MNPLHLQNIPIWKKGPLSSPKRYYIVYEAIDEVKINREENRIDFILAGRCYKIQEKTEIANHYVKLEEFPEGEEDPLISQLMEIPFTIQVFAEDIVRIKWTPSQEIQKLYGKSPYENKKVKVKGREKERTFEDYSPMIDENFTFTDIQCEIEEKEDEWTINTEHLKINIKGYPFSIQIRRKEDNTVLIETPQLRLDWVPNGYGFSLGCIYSPQTRYKILSYFGITQNIWESIENKEHYYGCGEEYGTLDKSGRIITLDTCDATTTDTIQMYKPIPFFMSTRGFGIFIHESAPITLDFGATFFGRTYIESLSPRMDLFVICRPSLKKILERYTDITGKAKNMPPAWSFGLWMSRISYRSEEEVKTVMKELREHKIPTDVIHIDTDWFENEWECDFRWSPRKFPHPEEMIEEAHENGFKISLWQLPYINVKTELYKEGKELGVFAEQPETREVQAGVIDVSNPKAIEWYKELIRSLFKQGVDVIKVDFGESAYDDYKYNIDGLYMHNLYPLLYNKLQFEVSKEFKKYPIIWARSAWAGSQRYPLHWAGDSKATFPSLFTTMRGGLSFGLSGFTFWSHDIGGFMPRPTPELYLRWAQFGLFCTHSRCHGAPPREPWTFGEEIEKIFRLYDSFKYRLLPYIYTYSYYAMKRGWPFIAPLFFTFQDEETGKLKDPLLYTLEDQYMFGPYFLVAPVFQKKQEKRQVYLPEGNWFSLTTLLKKAGQYEKKITVEKESYYDIKEGTMTTINLTLETFPVWIKEDAIIILGPLSQYLPEDHIEIEEIHIFPPSIQEKQTFKTSIYTNGQLKQIEFAIKRQEEEYFVEWITIPTEYEENSIRIILHIPSEKVKGDDK